MTPGKTRKPHTNLNRTTPSSPSLSERGRPQSVHTQSASLTSESQRHSAVGNPSVDAVRRDQISSQSQGGSLTRGSSRKRSHPSKFYDSGDEIKVSKVLLNVMGLCSVHCVVCTVYCVSLFSTYFQPQHGSPV